MSLREWPLAINHILFQLLAPRKAENPGVHWKRSPTISGLNFLVIWEWSEVCVYHSETFYSQPRLALKEEHL